MSGGGEGADAIDPDRLARRAIVRGRVQGVFFRQATKRRADAEGLAGWAANRPDGSVEVWIEGEPEAVERLLAFLREGPGDSRVEEVAVQAVPARGLGGFETR